MRILVVDDDTDIRNTLKLSLETEGFAVDTAPDGEQGSYLGRTNEYDLIILDLMMPKKDGYMVCQEIRQSGKSTPIIMLSVNNEIYQKVDLLNAGADDYLTKPFSFNELLARMKALHRRPKALVQETIRVDDLELNTSTQKVYRGDEEIYLTRKEYALLEYLIKQQGAVVSRGAIMEHVWNAESDPFSNTIEAHILNLRRKVDTSTKKKLIETVPGRGYRINV